MIKINIFLIDHIDKKPWLKVSLPAIPRVGDGFEMEKGIMYQVHSIWFAVNKNKTCSVNLAIHNPNEIDGPEMIKP
jgi:hypothetical protein